MAGLNAGPEMDLTAAPVLAPSRPVSSRRHFTTITWLRWRIFVNSLRGKGAAGELAVKILSYPFLALIVLGPSVGSGFAGWYVVSRHRIGFLALLLWGIFGLWQFIGLSTSATGPSFDLSSLIRFPIRYRDYLLIRLSFGLLDPPTVAGVFCLIATSIGIGIADPSLFPWAAVALIVFAVCNILFSRMIYAWTERWMARRRTRELLTGLVLVGSLCMQFAGQYAGRLSEHAHRGGMPLFSPFWRQVIHGLVAVNWLLPPGLTAAVIDRVHSSSFAVAAACFGGLLLFTSAFLLVLHLRLQAEYNGENLSEAPAGAVASKAALGSQLVAARAEAARGGALGFLPATVAAGLLKEIRYLLRSGPKLYVLIMPVFVTFLISMRSTGMYYAGLPGNAAHGMLFAYGCAYTQLIFVALIYNSLGSDGAGVQFYFMAPVRIRDVMLAKNLLTFTIFAAEAILIYITSIFVAAQPNADLAAATLAWSLFVLFLNTAIGNLRSISSPKVVEQSKMRGQNVSGMSGLISMAFIVACVALGAGAVIVCQTMQASLWVVAAGFAVLAIASLLIYITVLERMDSFAARHVEDLTATLSKL